MRCDHTIALRDAEHRVGTPTLFVNKASDQYRLSGLVDLVRCCNAESLRNGEVDFNFDKPTANTRAHLPLRESLTTKLQAFTGISKRPLPWRLLIKSASTAASAVLPRRDADAQRNMDVACSR